MNKIKALVTALVLASSSVAMASPSTFSASARGSFTVGSSWSPTGPSAREVVQVRDHRTTRTRGYQNDRHGGRFVNDRYDFRAMPAYDYGYDRGYDHEIDLDAHSWLNIGSRSANRSSYITMPTNEPVTLLHLEAEVGRPLLAKVVVRYHSGAQHEINVSAMRASRQGLTIPLAVTDTPIHQIIFYPATGSSGSFIASVAR